MLNKVKKNNVRNAGPHRPLRCINVAWSIDLLRCVQVGWCWDIMFWRPQETRLGPICWRSTGTTRICSPAYKYASHAHKWCRKILLKESSKLKVAPNNHLHNTLDCSHLLSKTPPHSPFKNKKCLILRQSIKHTCYLFGSRSDLFGKGLQLFGDF